MPAGLKREDVLNQIEKELADDIGVRISRGNNKLSKIPNVSIIPGKDCPGQVAECKYCYARDTMRWSTWAEVRWRVNSFYARNQPDRFVEDLCAQVYLARHPYFRIHVGGDFFSQEYLRMWFRVCERLPKTRFLAFTKSFGLDYSDKPDNLEVIWSVFPSTEPESVPHGPRAYTQFDKLKLYHHPDVVDRLKTAIRCVGSCESCGMCFDISTHQFDVKFHAHGSTVKWAGLKRDPKGRFLPREEV